MGRKKIDKDKKKGKLSVTISQENYDQLVEDGMNKSQLINWLLEQYFASLTKDSK